MRVIGYAADADIWCPQCLPYDTDGTDSEGNEVQPVFEDEEVDSPLHCCKCGAFLGGVLTAEGEAYVREAVKSGKGNPEVLRQWKEHYHWLFEDEE